MQHLISRTLTNLSVLLRHSTDRSAAFSDICKLNSNYRTTYRIHHNLETGEINAMTWHEILMEWDSTKHIFPQNHAQLGHVYLTSFGLASWRKLILPQMQFTGKFGKTVFIASKKFFQFIISVLETNGNHLGFWASFTKSRRNENPILFNEEWKNKKKRIKDPDKNRRVIIRRVINFMSKIKTDYFGFES